MFDFLGTVRQCQWKSFRDWVLRERGAVSRRLSVINAELNRIGRITVFYRSRNQEIRTLEGSIREQETVTEEREKFTVSKGSSLEKLVQAYIASGGNPMSISLWLQPDEILWTGSEDPTNLASNDPNELFTDVGSESQPPSQPYSGVYYNASTDSYDVGGRYPGGIPISITSTTRLAGKYIDEADAGAKIAILMDWSRRWVRQEIAEMSGLEAKILKLMDLREQLMFERDTLVQQAVGGSVPDYLDPPDADRFARNLHLTELVRQMDSVFYETDENGEPDFSRINLGTRADGSSLSEPGNNIQGGETSQIIPSGIAFYDTLFADPPGTDPYAA